jgi:hypothetical protein
MSKWILYSFFFVFFLVLRMGRYHFSITHVNYKGKLYFLLLNVVCLAENKKILTVLSLVWLDLRIYGTRGDHDNRVSSNYYTVDNIYYYDIIIITSKCMLIRKGMDLSENERISKLQLDTNLRKGAALLLYTRHRGQYFYTV